MSSGCRPKKEHVRCRGIQPSRPQAHTQQAQSACPECGHLVTFVETVDEAPVKIVNCAQCGIIFNRETGDVVGQRHGGKDNE